jgi:serine/threonine protein kinase
MGHPAHRAEEVSDLGEQAEESVTGVGVPNVLLVTTRELQRGDVLGARYQIEAVIGTGGSGRVLRAFDREARTPVALKILRPEFAADPVWAERFSRELRIGRSIIHPNVCRVFDIGDADGHKFLSMELASRGSIRGEVPKIGATRMTPTRPQRAWAERVDDARSVVDGVAALHGAGIIHRDIKPENILRMEDGRLVVTDFGLATDPGANAGNTVMVGTPSYMAPEVVMGDPATARSDVWGLGIVLHEILFGCRPQWKAAGRGYRRFVPPDDITTAAQRAAAALCGRCADDNPEVRPASAIEVGSELARALRGKRRFIRPGRRSVVWGALAVASFATLGLVREHWSNRAQASLSGAAAPVAERVLTPTGTPEDWSTGATKVVSFPSRLHCYALLDHARTLRAIWGTPRKAQDIDVQSGERVSAPLLAETYQDGCPVLSPDGRRLLFERASDSGTQIFLSDSPNGANPRSIVRGSAPQWLPNGQEFAMEFDSKHAAIFSIPTGDIFLVGDDSEGAKRLSEKTIDYRGGRIAIRSYSEKLDNLVVVRKLPSLEVIGRVVLPPSALRLSFSPVTGDLLAAVDGGGSAGLEIAAVDLEKNTLKALGTMQGRNLRELLYGANSDRFVVSEQIERDLWNGDQRLTHDGHSEAGSLSINGDLVIQKRLADGRIVISLRRPNGVETQVTNGPFDLGPAFLPDGRSWLHLKYDAHEIVKCDVRDATCAPIYTDSMTPIWLALDPAGARVAYISLTNTPRLHVLSLIDRSERTLGPVGLDCPPYWPSADRVWVRQSKNGAGQVWVEIDVPSGERTGAQLAPSGSSDLLCEPPASLVRSNQGGIGRVSARSGETWDISRVNQAI